MTSTQQPTIDVLRAERYETGNPDDNGMPHDQYDYLRDHAPVHSYPLTDPELVKHAWVVSRHADVVAILRDDEQYYSSEGSGLRLFDPTVRAHGGKPSMVSMDGAEHQTNRRVVSRAFTPTVIRSFEDTYRALAADLVDKALAKGSIDFVHELAAVLPLIAICDLIGIPETDRAQILTWTNALTVPGDPDLSPSLETLTAAVIGIWRYGLTLSQQRREQSRPDMMSTIAAAAERGELTDDEVMGFMLSLTAAGTETTQNSASHGLLALLQRPDEMAWLRANSTPVPDTAIEEILRWSSPVIHSRRTARNAVELHGVSISPGDPVVVLYPAANFDPSAFDDPMRFDLTRKPNRHVTFATGRHLCLGAHIARLELRILFEELLARTSSIEQIGPVKYVRDARLRGIKSFPVRLTPA